MPSISEKNSKKGGSANVLKFSRLLGPFDYFSTINPRVQDPLISLGGDGSMKCQWDARRPLAKLSAL